MKKNRNNFFSQYGTVAMNTTPYPQNIGNPNIENRLYTIEKRIQELEQKVYNLEMNNNLHTDNNSMYMI